MREFLLPYGKETLKAEIEEEHLAGVLVSELHDYKAPMEGTQLVQEALEHPIGTPRLCDMAAMKHHVPLWVGEFGSQYHGYKEEIPYRLKSMEDQLGIYNAHGVHWTTWTYKDPGIMGWVFLDPDSEYMKIIQPTPGLAAAASMTDSNIPSVAYATVYPIAMVFLILIIQVIASAVY